MHVPQPAVDHRIEQVKVFHYREIVMVKQKQRSVILWLQFPVYYRVNSNTAVPRAATPRVGQFFEWNDLEHLAIEDTTEVNIRMRVSPELKFVPNYWLEIVF